MHQLDSVNGWNENMTIVFLHKRFDPHSPLVCSWTFFNVLRMEISTCCLKAECRSNSSASQHRSDDVDRVKDGVYSLPALRTHLLKEIKTARISTSLEAGLQMRFWQRRSLGAAWITQLRWRFSSWMSDRRRKKKKHDKVRVHDWIIQRIKGQCNSLTWEKKQFVRTTRRPWYFECMSPWKTLSDCFCGKLEVWMSCKSHADEQPVECVHEPLSKLRRVFLSCLLPTGRDFSPTGNFFLLDIFQVHRVLHWKLQSCCAYKP